MATRHRIEIARELFKFSCAHMTVFPDGTKERLHGHNYFVGVVVELTRIGFADMVPFAPLKTAVTEICQELREHLLLPAHNPLFEVIADDAVELEFRLCGRRYVVPRDEAIILPVDNVTVEALAEHIGTVLLTRQEGLFARDWVAGLEVMVTESPGQGARAVFTC